MENIACILVGAHKYTQNEYTPKIHVSFTNAAQFNYKFLFLEKFFTHYVWQGKKVRMKTSKLHRNKVQAGLAVPNVRLCYWLHTVTYSLPATALKHRCFAETALKHRHCLATALKHRCYPATAL